MATEIRMINLYDQKETIIYSDDKDLLIRNLLEVFCIEEDDRSEIFYKDTVFITTPYSIEIPEQLHRELLKAISDIRQKRIYKIVINSIFENCKVQTTIIERK